MRNMSQTMNLAKKLSVLAVSAVLAACAVGPDYKQPQSSRISGSRSAMSS
jgi:hypothetical protein